MITKLVPTISNLAVATRPAASVAMKLTSVTVEPSATGAANKGSSAIVDLTHNDRRCNMKELLR